MSHEEYHMGFFANSFLLWTDSRSKRLPGFLSSVHASFFLGKGSFWSTPSVKYRLTLQLPLPGGDCGPGVSLCFYFFPLRCNERTSPFLLRPAGFGTFQFIFNWREMKVKHLESEVPNPKHPGIQGFIVLLSFTKCPMSLHLQNFLCFSHSCVAHRVPGLCVYLGCQI